MQQEMAAVCGGLHCESVDQEKWRLSGDTLGWRSASDIDLLSHHAASRSSSSAAMSTGSSGWDRKASR